MVANSNWDRELQDAKCAEELGRGSARPFRFAGLSSQVAVVYLRNDGVPWKSDFASWRVRKTKSQPAGVFGTEGLRVMTVSGTAFEKFPPD